MTEPNLMAGYMLLNTIAYSYKSISLIFTLPDGGPSKRHLATAILPLGFDAAANLLYETCTYLRKKIGISPEKPSRLEVLAER